MHAKCSKYPPWQVLLRTGWLLPWQPAQARSIFHTACQQLFFYCDKVDSWCVTFYREPVTWLVVLIPSPILSLNTLILSSDARVWWHGKPQNKPGNVWSQTTQSHCETLSRATHAPRLMGILSLGSGTVYPFVPSETFWSRGCRMSPSRSWVFLQPPRRLPPVSSFICSVGNMIPSPSARLDAHKPATECVLPPERNTLIKYVAGVSNPQVEILCSSEHSPLVGTVLSLKVLYHKYLHREIGY